MRCSSDVATDCSSRSRSWSCCSSACSPSPRSSIRSGSPTSPRWRCSRSSCASAGLLYGRVGLVSLGQVASYGIGCWVTMRLAFATSLPFPLLLLIGGLVAAVIGVLIGLPALRVSGLYLALVTLMLAAGVEIVLSADQVPQRRSRVQGVVDIAQRLIKPTRRPSFALDRHGVLPLHRRRRLRDVHARLVRACPASPAGPGRRSARARRRRWRPEST